MVPGRLRAVAWLLVGLRVSGLGALLGLMWALQARVPLRRAVLLAPAAGTPNGFRSAGAHALLGHLYLIGAALAWALAILHSRGHRWHLSPLQVMPWQMLFAFVLLVPLACLRPAPY